MNARVLIVDDEDTLRSLYSERLAREGFTVTTAGNADHAEKLFQSGGEVGVLVTDLKMPGKDGFQLMAWVKQYSPHTKVIVVTGHGEKDAAVSALRGGACEYLEKPIDMNQFSHAVTRAMKEYGTEANNRELRDCLEARVQRAEATPSESYWFKSPSSSMQPVHEMMDVLRRESMRMEAEEPTVLVLGESGTGKEGIARMVHSTSRRGKGPWVAVNCANFQENLLDSELFGHEKGAFTGASMLKRGLFEMARGGTLFLDELGEMEVKLQAKLLRVLQEKVFRRVGGTTDIVADVRVIAATNRNLQERVKAGEFREDLYFRINRLQVTVPALRERSDDVVTMAKEFADRAFRSRGKTFGGFSPDAAEAMRSYRWPGNVRELVNIVERLALVSMGAEAITVRGLGLPQVKESAGGATVSGTDEAAAFQSFTEMKKRWSDAFEREYLMTVLGRHSGNVSAAAREANLDRSNFLRLLRRHALKAEIYRRQSTTDSITETDRFKIAS